MDVDTDSKEQEQEHGADICKIVVLVTIVVMWCGLFGWCMRASRTLIGYHASFLKTLMVIQSNQTKADVDSNEQEQEHRSTQLAIALLLTGGHFFMCCGLFGLCMRALQTLIGYHTSLLRMMTVVVLCGVLGSCMRASRTLICYQASLLKMFRNSRKFYNSCKSTTVACFAC